jgi:entericidin B
MELTVMRRVGLILGLVALSLVVSACNTVRGAGDDLKSAANAVDRAL